MLKCPKYIIKPLHRYRYGDLVKIKRSLNKNSKNTVPIEMLESLSPPYISEIKEIFGLGQHPVYIYYTLKGIEGYTFSNESIEGICLETDPIINRWELLDL